MDAYLKSIEVRWADLDPNFHMTHSRYYDLGAYIRMCYFIENGITPHELHAHRLGPILLREECVFRKEIRFGDKVDIDMQMVKARPNFLRWSIRHHIRRNDELSAIINVDGTWIHLDRRKMAMPPQAFNDVFISMPRAEDFHWI
jgi:acyl-CoA thioester hydrolase